MLTYSCPPCLSWFPSIDHQTNIETEADHSGSSLGISEMMLGLPRFRTVTATSIVECYEINVRCWPGVGTYIPASDCPSCCCYFI